MRTDWSRLGGVQYKGYVRYVDRETATAHLRVVVVGKKCFVSVMFADQESTGVMNRKLNDRREAVQLPVSTQFVSDVDMCQDRNLPTSIG